MKSVALGPVVLGSDTAYIKLCDPLKSSGVGQEGGVQVQAKNTQECLYLVASDVTIARKLHIRVI